MFAFIKYLTQLHSRDIREQKLKEAGRRYKLSEDEEDWTAVCCRIVSCNVVCFVQGAVKHSLSEIFSVYILQSHDDKEWTVNRNRNFRF